MKITAKLTRQAQAVIPNGLKPRAFLRAALDGVRRKALHDMELQFARDTIPAWVSSMERQDAEKAAMRELQLAMFVYDVKMRAARRADEKRRQNSRTFSVLLRGERARALPG